MNFAKSLSHRIPVISIAKLGATLGVGALLVACSGNTELAEANKKLDAANARIAALEAKLAGIPTPPPTAAQVSASATGDGVEPAQAGGEQWSYEAVEDEMTGKKRYFARVDSSNTVDFDFPYRGDQHGHITLRTDPRYGKDVMFSIDKGQILCPSYQGCRVRVRFDDDAPVSFGANGPADHSTEVIFITDYKGFVAKLKKSKRVRIAVPIYRNGEPAFEFDVSGFVHDKYQPRT